MLWLAKSDLPESGTRRPRSQRRRALAMATKTQRLKRCLHRDHCLPTLKLLKPLSMSKHGTHLGFPQRRQLQPRWLQPHRRMMDTSPCVLLVLHQPRRLRRMWTIQHRRTSDPIALRTQPLPLHFVGQALRRTGRALPLLSRNSTPSPTLE